MTVKKLIYTSVLLLCFHLASTAREGRLALVIGNSDYQHVTQLKNPINDAEDMAEKLRQLDFDVMLFTNLDKDSMKLVIRAYGKRLRDYETGLFFYAGHGVEVGGNNYFVPVDSDAKSVEEVKQKNVAIFGLISAMRISHCKTKIIILDACRNNPFPYSKGQESGGLALMDAPEGSIVCFSTSPGRTASDGSGDNGLYTESMLKHIMTPDLELGEFFHRVRADVLDQSNKGQIPWETTSLTDNFVFNITPEMSMSTRIIEGDKAVFKGYGTLHAQSNILNVSYQWFLNNELYAHGASLDIKRSGYYFAKGTSPQGQQAITDSILVTVQSLVKPQVKVKEGDEVKFDGYGELHGLSNMTGSFNWYRDGQLISDEHSIVVSKTGVYNVEIRTVENELASSGFVTVKVKQPKVTIVLGNSEMYRQYEEQFQEDFSEVFEVEFMKMRDFKKQENTSFKDPYFIMLSDDMKEVGEYEKSKDYQLTLPLFTQYFGLYAKDTLSNVSVVYARERDRNYISIFEKLLERELTYVFSSDTEYESALLNQSGVLFLHLSQSRLGQHDFKSKYGLHTNIGHYNDQGKYLLINGHLAVDSFLIGSTEAKYTKDYKVLIGQFMYLKSRVQMHLDYIHSCKTIIGGSTIPVHEGLFYELSQNPTNCR
ncbi:MAG: caspase family protein [Reichenbachiella sp.]